MPLTKERLDPFQLVADPTRRAMIELLADGDQPVTALAKHCGVSLSAVSQQLKVLRRAGLVSDERRGRQRLYRLHAGPLEALSDWAARACERFWRDRLEGLGAKLDQGKDEKPR